MMGGTYISYKINMVVPNTCKILFFVQFNADNEVAYIIIMLPK